MRKDILPGIISAVDQVRQKATTFGKQALKDQADVSNAIAKPVVDFATRPGSFYGEVTSPEYKKAIFNPKPTVADIDRVSAPIIGMTGTVEPLVPNMHAAFATKIGQAIDQGYSPSIDEVGQIMDMFRSTLKGSKKSVSKIMSQTPISEMVSNIRGMISPEQEKAIGDLFTIRQIKPH